MNRLFNSKVGRLRVIGFFEGVSLLALFFIAVPFKYMYHNPVLVRSIGPVHGLLFLMFVFSTLNVGTEQHWKFKTTTWKLLLACIIPFGTFYIDHKILAPLQRATESR